MALTATLTERQQRFRPGDEVYCRNWQPTDTGKITGVAGGLFPSYWVVDPDGYEWQIAQILLSRRPIVVA